MQLLRTQIGLELFQVITIIRQALLFGTFFEVAHDSLWPCESTKLLMPAGLERLSPQAQDKCFGLGAVDTARALTQAPCIREKKVYPLSRSADY